MSIKYYPDKLCHFRPQLINTDIASPNNTQISRSKMTGRMLYFAGKLRDFDTMVASRLPDSNFHTEISMILRHQTEQDYRIALFKGVKNYLHFYVLAVYTEEPRQVGIYEVDADAFDIYKVTWNTRPNMGDLITTLNFNMGTEKYWEKVSMGSKKAIGIQIVPGSYAGYTITSSEYTDNKELRPYFTDE